MRKRCCVLSTWRSRIVKFDKPDIITFEYSESKRIAPEFCLIFISGISNGSNGGMSNSGIPLAKLGRIDSTDARRQSSKFGSFRLHGFHSFAFQNQTKINEKLLNSLILKCFSAKNLRISWFNSSGKLKAPCTVTITKIAKLFTKYIFNCLCLTN